MDAPSTSSGDGLKYAIIRNIPGILRSKDLRIFFASFIESRKFDCFHFRHRPEVKTTKDAESDAKSEKKPPTCCCIVRLKRSKDREDFHRIFNGKRWTLANGTSLPLRCFVTKVKLSQEEKEKESEEVENPQKETSEGLDNTQKQTSEEVENLQKEISEEVKNLQKETSEEVENHQKDTSDGNEGSLEEEKKNFLTEADLLSMPELHPPSLMPQGNIGTPTAYFMERIQACSLPPAVIKKLGLHFPKKLKSKLYSSVPFDYGLEIKHQFESIEEEVMDRINPPDCDDQSKRPDEDDDECEEWERHEAMYDDVTQHDRTKPRLYEEEMEVVWEKGGPGIVWYTDDFFWDQQAGGDMDEMWADDWDVDMEIYYDPAAGDKDARDSMQIRQEKALQNGEVDSSVFEKKKEAKKRRGPNSKQNKDSKEGESFEKYSKGVARRVMEAQGWKDGEGLGGSQKGKPYSVALDVQETSQGPRSFKGFGYHGEKLIRTVGKRVEKHKITTVYDDPKLTDPKPSINRRSEPDWTKAGHWVKYQHQK